MQKDFHYYTIAMLAHHAGFSDQRARVLATASQYVDDATESFPLYLQDGRVMETTMTAHYHLRALAWGVQRDVYMCFHFPPQGVFFDQQRFCYNTVSDASIINKLLEDILISKNDPKQVVSSNGHPFWMYRLGVALHAYADSWSHQTFSGRYNLENDVGKIWTIGKNGSEKRQYLYDWKYNFAPKIGHAEIGHYVDIPWRCFRYELKEKNQWRSWVRNNPAEFIEAAKSCLSWLLKFSGQGDDWDDRAPAMKAIYSLLFCPLDKPEKRIAAFRDHPSFAPFADLFAEEEDYNPNNWPREAFDTNDGKELKRSFLRIQRIGFFINEKTDFNTSDFRLFHRAARAQRVFMLNELFW